MTTLRILYHLARADFLERARRSSFLVLAGVTIYMGYLFVPPVGANYQTVALGDARGMYNSPWIGTMFGIMISTLMTLVAFFLVKNAVIRDRQTRVGSIIATTPMRKPVYLLGKWLSNVAVLALLMLIMTIMALVMQWVRAEDLRIDVWALVTPIWLMGLPALAVVAALAVLFECIPFLQGGFGNIVYFFFYMTMLITVIEGTTDADGLLRPSNDFFGISHPLADMQRVVARYDPEYQGALIIGAAELSDSPLRFPWDGMDWTLELMIQRLSWVGVAALIVLGAALPFDRFDPARRRAPRERKRGRNDRVENYNSESPGTGMATPVISSTSLTSLPNRRSHWRFGAVLRVELRLMLKGHKMWWYVVAVGLAIAGMVTPLDIAHGILLPFVWLWPILIWSVMGCREWQSRTHELVFAVARPVRRQLFAVWVAGLGIAVLSGGTIALRLLLAGQWMSLFAWYVGALFIPALALALGVWSRGQRAFQLVYLLLWYLLTNGVYALDFMGISLEAQQRGYPFVYLGLVLVLLLAASVGRWRSLRG